MTPEESSTFPHENDDEVLDRLADGELSGDEYRRLLASLDDRPDGWKRCALALLEAQAWRGELQGLFAEQPRRESPRNKRPTPDGVPSASGGASKVHWATLVLSVAASFLLALGIGVWLRGTFSTSPARELANQPSEARPPEQEGFVRDAAESVERNQNARTKETETVVLPRGCMTLVVDDGEGESEEVELPVYDVSAVDPAWFEGAAISQADVEALEASGFHLLQQRGMVPFDLGGRRVLVPMEAVEIVPVSAVLQ